VSSDRSTLEGKDRAELVVIAEAMGHKVTSRMRKGTIVDLIVGPDSDDDTDSADSGAEAEPSSNGSDSGDSDDSGDSGDSDGAESDDDTDNADHADDGASGDDDARSDDDDAAEETDKGDADSGEAAGDSSGSKKNNDAPEPGNKRRRRRRGRDREELPWEGEPLAGALASRDDCYVPVKMVRQFGLRSGDQVRGTSRPAARNEKNPALLSVDAINERDPEEAKQRVDFSSPMNNSYLSVPPRLPI